MPFTAQELTNIQNGTLDYFFAKGDVWAQAIQEKPVLKAFDASAGTFSGGQGKVSLGVKQGGAGGQIAGYSHDDQLTYYNPATGKRVAFPWKEHFLGMGVTHTELKNDGITVVEDGSDYTTTPKEGREQHALAKLLEEKVADFNEDWAASWNRLLIGDGTSDTKALAGIRAFILDNPALGSSGGLNRTTNSWWRNRAATAAAAAAGTGNNAITSSSTGGGALLRFLQRERRLLRKYSRGAPRHKCFAGIDFLTAMEDEIRANGLLSQSGWRDRSSNDAAQATDDGVPFGNWTFVHDPTLDDLGLSKRAYVIDFSRIKLLYMQGEKMKKSNPARPHDRMVMYNGVSSTAVMIAQQLNTSGVYDIA